MDEEVRVSGGISLKVIFKVHRAAQCHRIVVAAIDNHLIAHRRIEGVGRNGCLRKSECRYKNQDY